MPLESESEFRPDPEWFRSAILTFVNFVRVLEVVQKFLADRGYRYALAGAMAMHGHGMSRATNDLDFVVEDRAREAIVAWLESLGFETLNHNDAFSNHVHPLRNLGKVDFIYLDPHTAEVLFNASSVKEILPGVSAPIPKAEHMAAMKAQAVRDNRKRQSRDLADVAFLWDLPGVDREQIRRYFQEYGLSKELEDELSRSKE